MATNVSGARHDGMKAPLTSSDDKSGFRRVILSPPRCRRRDMYTEGEIRLGTTRPSIMIGPFGLLFCVCGDKNFGGRRFPIT